MNIDIHDFDNLSMEEAVAKIYAMVWEERQKSRPDRPQMLADMRPIVKDFIAYVDWYYNYPNFPISAEKIIDFLDYYMLEERK